MLREKRCYFWKVLENFWKRNTGISSNTNPFPIPTYMHLILKAVKKKKYEKIGYKLGTVHRVIELLSAYELSLLLGLSVL